MFSETIRTFASNQVLSEKLKNSEEKVLVLQAIIDKHKYLFRQLDELIEDFKEKGQEH